MTCNLQYAGAFHAHATDRGGRWYRAANAVVVGDVVIGAQSSLWYHAVARGDDAPIQIGERVNIQDGCMLHADPGVPLVLEDDITIGHRAVVHCVRIGAETLIGMGAILMEGVEIGAGSLVAAGCVISPHTVVPPRSLVRGLPGRVVRETTEDERAAIRKAAHKYATNATDFFDRYGEVS